MAKKRKAARKRVTRKPTRKRRASSPDTTINTLVILVVIVIVLGGLYLYAQNKKQAALWPGLMQKVETLIAPQPHNNRSSGDGNRAGASARSSYTCT